MGWRRDRKLSGERDGLPGSLRRPAQNTQCETGLIVLLRTSPSRDTRVAVRAPSFAQVLLLLLLPCVLIALNTGIGTLRAPGASSDDAVWADVLQLIGQTPSRC